MSMNVAQVANQFLENIDKVGFGGIKARNIKRESIWHEQYAIFQFEFDTPIDLGFERERNCEYCVPGYFDTGKFHGDFDDLLKTVFPKCEINSNHRINEYEIIGPNYKK